MVGVEHDMRIVQRLIAMRMRPPQLSVADVKRSLERDAPIAARHRELRTR